MFLTKSVSLYAPSTDLVADYSEVSFATISVLYADVHLRPQQCVLSLRRAKLYRKSPIFELSEVMFHTATKEAVSAWVSLTVAMAVSMPTTLRKMTPWMSCRAPKTAPVPGGPRHVPTTTPTLGIVPRMRANMTLLLKSVLGWSARV